MPEMHSVRHSIAVHLREADQGIEYVADHLGHKNIQKLASRVIRKPAW
jgi:site-specific recombinase XerC